MPGGRRLPEPGVSPHERHQAGDGPSPLLPGPGRSGDRLVVLAAVPRRGADLPAHAQHAGDRSARSGDRRHPAARVQGGRLARRSRRPRAPVAVRAHAGSRVRLEPQPAVAAPRAAGGDAAERFVRSRSAVVLRQRAALARAVEGVPRADHRRQRELRAARLHRLLRRQCRLRLRPGHPVGGEHPAGGRGAVRARFRPVRLGRRRRHATRPGPRPDHGFASLPLRLPRELTESYVQILDLDGSQADKTTYENIVFTLGAPTLPLGTEGQQ